MDLNIRSKVREHISRRLLRKYDSGTFADSESLFVSGRLDSLDALETVVFLESVYGIDFAKNGFDIALIDSIDAISAIAGE
jgi:acyl carrier protein